MAGKIVNYYAGGNTGRGFYSLFESNLKGLDRLFILKGGPGTGKSQLMKKISEIWSAKGFDLELIHCSSDNNSLDGLIIPQLKIGIVDGTAPHVIEPSAPGVIEEYVNIGAGWDSRSLRKNKKQILKLQSEITRSFQSAYKAFEEGLRYHDDLEDIYLKEMDFSKADELTDELISRLLKSGTSLKRGERKDRFLGAATPEGAVDFIPNLTEGLKKRFFIKGRAGTGKSTLLKKIANAAEEKGYDTEVYHCGFDPESLDMVIIRELGAAVFDSTDPHEYFPERDGDEIIDMYLAAVTPGTDEKFSIEIEEAHRRYKEKMSEGTSWLAREKELHDELEKYYISAMDFGVVDQLLQEINDEIKAAASGASAK